MLQAALVGLFDRYDADGDGLLCRAEYKLLLQGLEAAQVHSVDINRGW